VKRLIAAALLAGSLSFGVASAAAAPIQAAFWWATGGTVAATVTAVVVRRIVCRNGTVLELAGSEISFNKPGGKRYGPYKRS